MSIRFRVAGRLLLCALTLLLLVSIPLVAKENGDMKSGERRVSKEHRPPIVKRVSSRSSYDKIFTGHLNDQVMCSADCGGWYFDCTGSEVYCEDGVGCWGTDGKNTVEGLCEAN